MCLCTLSVTVVLIELCRKESSLFMKESQLRLYYRNKGARTLHEFLCCDVMPSFGVERACLLLYNIAIGKPITAV